MRRSEPARPSDAGDQTPKTAGLILAGGQGRRMGGEDKGLLRAGKGTFVQQLATRMTPWVNRLAISANRNQSCYRNWGDAVLSDHDFAGEGPLAGLLAGLEWACQSGASEVLVSPCDTPALTERFFQALIQQARVAPGQAVVARVADNVQPLHGLFPAEPTCKMLRRWLISGRRDARGFVASLSPHWLDCDDMREGFLNINRPADLEQLQKLLPAVD